MNNNEVVCSLAMASLVGVGDPSDAGERGKEGGEEGGREGRREGRGVGGGGW
jgi:hypothetical protein